MDQDTLNHALKIFEIADPLPPDQLKKRYQELLWRWHPHRYASLTNNPQKYMEMYKKGETKTKEVHGAFEVLKAWLENPKNHPPQTENTSSRPESKH